MPVTFEMTNWTDTSFDITNWTDSYPVLDPALEEFVEEIAYNETLDEAAAASGGYTFTNRHVAMSVVPHITGLLSLLGSALIVWDVYSKRFRSVYDRLLFGLAVSDIIASLGMALSTWPVPEYQAQSTWGAVGNIQSCEFQGFIIQLGLATPLYSAALSIYYVLLVKFNYRPDSVNMLRFEKMSHFFASFMAVTTAVICLAMKQYNNANIWCWIAPYPYGCEDSGTCERGNHATVFRMVFYFSWLWISFIIVTIAMVMLAWTVISQTAKMDRYRQKGQKRSKVQTDRIRNVVTQSSLYILAFMITALPLSVARVYQAKYSCSSTFFPLSMTTVTVFPMQGFWNAIIYFRTRFTKHLAEQELTKRLSTLVGSSMFGSSMRSLGSIGSRASRNGSFTDLFSKKSSGTQATSQANSSQALSNDGNDSASLGLQLDLSDSEDEDDGADEDRHASKGWSIDDLKAQVPKMEDVEDDEDNKEGTKDVDESLRRLRAYEQYLANQDKSAKSQTREKGDEPKIQRMNSGLDLDVKDDEPVVEQDDTVEPPRDVEMDGSKAVR